MRAHRTFIFIGALLAALTVALPAAAQASSLLSGYGGPGQGNQAILGSALVNGPRGGGGGGSGSSSGSGGSGTGSSEAVPSEGATSSASRDGAGTSSASGAAGARHRHANGSSHTGAAAAQSQGIGQHPGTAATPTATASFYPASERIPAGEQGGVLGLSGSDLVYIILGFAALAFLGVLTGRLGRASVSDGTRG